MLKTKTKLTVFFDEPLWVGVYEYWNNDDYSVCKIRFGAEPKDYEIYEFTQKNYHNLHFSPNLNNVLFEEKRINPKRLQRQISKQLQDTGAGTKSQQALKIQH